MILSALCNLGLLICCKDCVYITSLSNSLLLLIQLFGDEFFFANYQYQPAVSPPSRFFSANRRYVGARANIFGNTVNIALENLTNLWKYDIWYTLILDWYEI